MSNWGIEDDTNLAGDNNSPGPKALRDAYDALKQQNKDLADGLAAVNKQLRDTAVTSTLSTLGIPAAAATQYTGEADPEKVREWATTMQTIFGGAQSTPNTVDQQQAPQGLTPDQQAQLARMNDAGQQGQPLGNVEAANARINDATDLTGLLAAWKTL